MYKNFVIDPPWPKRKGGLRSVRPKQGRHLDYETMSIDDCFRVMDEVLKVADTNHNVFLWVVDGFLTEAEEQMTSRGYRRHARLIWDKENGTAPAFSVRYSHEYCIWFYKGKFIPVAQGHRGKFTTVLREKRREHSRKPDALYSLVTALYPNTACMDVFSRESRGGWSQWGNQTRFFDVTRA